MFLLTKGIYKVVKLDYSYSRRAQSTVRSLHWQQIATIDTDDLNEAINEANDYLKAIPPSERWKLEGIGKMAGIEHELKNSYTTDH
jgi:hypothetical protein